MDDSSGNPLPNDESDQQVSSRLKPRVWTVFVAVTLAMATAILLQVVVVVVLLFTAISNGTDTRKAAEQLPAQLATPGMVILLTSCGQLAYGLGAIIPAWLSPVSFRERLGLLAARPSWRVYPLTMLGTLVPLAVGLGLAEALSLILPRDPSTRMTYENMTLAAFVPFVLFIALAPGIFEELMFRGYIQRRLLQRWKPAWAIGATSVAFAMAHIEPHAVVTVFPLGIWCGVVAWRSDSVGPSILCHAFVNSSVTSWRVVVKFGEVPQTIQTIVLAVSLLVGVVCLVLSIRCFIGQVTSNG